MNALRLAWLSMWRSRGYAVSAIVLVAIGVAAVASVFAVADVILLRPVPYPDPGRLYFLFTRHQPEGANFPPSIADFEDYERLAQSFEAAGIVLVRSVVLRTASGAESHRVAYASAGLLQSLGVQPRIGRGLSAVDDQAGAAPTIVLSNESWIRLFAGDSSVVGRTLPTATGALTVVGVLPPATMFPGYAIGLSALGPYLAQNPNEKRRDARIGTLAVARLARSVSLSQGQAELTAISRQLANDNPASNAQWSAAIEPLRFVMADRFQNPMLLLVGGAVLVLVIAASNVAVLSLVRAGSLGHESALRRALGAGPVATFMPRLLESVLVVAVGASLGLLLAKWTLNFVATSLTSVVQRVSQAQLTAIGALVAAGAAAVLLGFAVVPALPQISAANLVGRMRSGTGRWARGHRFAAQQVLIVSQVALSLVLAVAGLSIVAGSLTALREGPGFDVARLISLPVEPSESRYPSTGARAALFGRLRETLLALPGVVAVGMISHAPLTQSGVLTAVSLGSAPSSPSNMAVFRSVDEHYFDAAGQRVAQGRSFDSDEQRAGSATVVVNQTFAQKFWPGESAVGKTVRVFDQSPVGGRFNSAMDVRVIGVVADVRDWGFSRPTLPAVYVPFSVSPWAQMTFAIRSDRDAREMMRSVKQVVAEIDSLLPISGARSGNDLVGESETPRRTVMWIVVLFGATATLLACFGVYAVVSQQVVRRARETGVRIAVGATKWDIVSGFVRMGCVLGAIGLLVGLCLTPGVRALLFWATPAPITLTWTPIAVAAVVLLAVVALAAFLAARRASDLHPVQLLRAE